MGFEIDADFIENDNFVLDENEAGDLVLEHKTSGATLRYDSTEETWLMDSLSTEQAEIGGTPVEKVERSWLWEMDGTPVDIDFSIPDLGTLERIKLHISVAGDTDPPTFDVIVNNDTTANYYETRLEVGGSVVHSETSKNKWELAPNSTENASFGGVWTIGSIGNDRAYIFGDGSAGRFTEREILNLGGIENRVGSLNSVQIDTGTNGISDGTIVISTEFWKGAKQ